MRPVLFFFILCSNVFTTALLAQVEPTVRPPRGTLPIRNDSTRRLPTDSVALQRDTTRADTVKNQPKGDIETTINYSARDSILASFDGQTVWLYGAAKITYGEIELEAEEIVIDYANNTLTAHGTRDSLGQRVGYPIFKNGAELYETKDIIYNFKTGRARITEVVTQQGEGFLSADLVYKNEDNELLTKRNSYTTCNLEHPHFRIRSTKTKAIPNDKIVSGPFYFEFNDIPLPIGFAFGMFPAERESKSGILFPSYGEERRRGFNLRGGGYFFDISEYVKLAITGDIYTKGGHAVNINSNYSKRYQYNGNLRFNYSRTRTSDRIENPQTASDFSLGWSHSPQSKGTSRFSASVNAATSTYNQNNNLIYGYSNAINSSSFSNITTKLSSNVSYSKKLTGTPFSIALNMSHNQDLVSKLVDLTLPNLTVNMTNLYPFQRRGKTGPLDNFVIGYSMSGSNRITNNIGRISPEATTDSIAPFTVDNLSLFFKNARNGIRHSIPISYSFRMLKYFTVSPSISYEEKWYFKRLDWRYVNIDDTYRFVSTEQKGFNRIANYSASTSLTTRLYGTYFFKRGNVKAIRHIINPSVSIGYTPDFTVKENYFQKFTDVNGNLVYKSRHEGFVYGSSTTGRSGSIGFGIGNNLEMKVKSAKDTVERKVMLLNNLSLNSSYNLVADSFKLAPFNISANTNILDNLFNINVSTSLDPYQYVKRVGEDGTVTEKRIDEYAWKGSGIGRITSASLAVSTNLNPKGRSEEQSTREKAASSNLPEQEKEEIIKNPNAYVNFEIPWSLRINYSLSYNHSVNQDAKITQSVQMSGDLSLSEKWKITLNSGYHFESKEFTQTDVGISRDLHCWQMRLYWVPFGRFQSFNFTIAVKASMLQDLKLERRKPFYDNL